VARKSTREVWSKCYFHLNELAAHAALCAFLIFVLFLLQWLNHHVQPPTGLMLFDDPRIGRVPLDWGFSVSDAGVLGRFAWMSMRIFSGAK
jgi:hypothetical protein